MKKKTLILSLAVFLLLTAIGIGWLALSPRGALRSQGPADAAQAFLDAHDRAFFREAYIRLEAPEVSEFEDAAAVAGGVFDAGVPEAPFTFRAASGSGKQQFRYRAYAGGNGKVFPEFCQLGRCLQIDVRARSAKQSVLHHL